MKRMYIILLLLSLVLITNINSLAAGLEAFTSKEGYQVAFDYAKNTLGFDDPEPLAIATTSTEVEILGTKYSVGLDISDGKSEGWSYIFISRKSNITVAVGVAKFLGNLQAQDITNQATDFIPDTSSSELNELCIDSDVLTSSISANANYQTFIAANPDAVPNAVVLMNNYTIPDYLQDYPYWIVRFDKPDTFACITDALTEETVCMDVPTSVETIEPVSNTFSPNPATNSIKLNLEKTPSTISIINMSGDKVYSSDSKQIYNIDITNLSSGVYMLVYEYSNKIEIEKLIINK